MMRGLMLASTGALALWSGAASAAEFVFTGDVQSFTVEQSGDYDIEAVGASGGVGIGGSGGGGRGAVLSGQVSLTAGTVLEIFVGGAGESGARGAGGGSGGGGGTFVFFNNGSPLTSANALVVAGGGGGGGFITPGDDATGSEIGGSGTGGAGNTSARGGGGGTGVDSNGSRGADAFGFGFGGVRPDQGAAGGSGGTSVAGSGGFGGGGGGGSTGGGGGGGFSGGGGGGSVGGLVGDSGGGAGTSFILETVRAATSGTAATTGNGRFTITLNRLADPVAPVPEPATWAMMIGGFGLVGGAMRRCRSSISYA